MIYPNKVKFIPDKPTPGWLVKFNWIIDGIIAANTIIDENFKNLIKPEAKIEVYTLKPELYGVLKKLNFNNGIKDAVMITCSNAEILSLKDIKEKMSNLFILNSILGLTSLALGVLFILLAFKAEKE